MDPQRSISQTAYSSPNPEYQQFREKFTNLVRYEIGIFTGAQIFN